ncbi:hypothetical protein J5N97_000419 [Dioscorea zingiberensis]|uniref:Uncharacterized protein n=1 Tax=Dioscorea zingiberensis TaxID=325984 RepID=A0A9D5H2Z7_9LILI|nr:hypothetical protein J5N97_000419 [Dioscorea zingiberensis]
MVQTSSSSALTVSPPSTLVPTSRSSSNTALCPSSSPPGSSCVCIQSRHFVLNVDATNNLPLECTIRRVFQSSQGTSAGYSARLIRR